MNETCLCCPASLTCITDGIVFVFSCKDCDTVEASREMFERENVGKFAFIVVPGRCPRRDEKVEGRTDIGDLHCEKCLDEREQERERGLIG